MTVPIICGACEYSADTIEKMQEHMRVYHEVADVDPDYWENTVNRVEQS